MKDADNGVCKETGQGKQVELAPEGLTQNH
jgi:hypothetical protein